MADDPTLGPDGGEDLPRLVVLPPRYRDLGRIASGGFGEVRRVEDLLVGSVLAMKILRADVLDPETRRRFSAEARLTARLHHPGVVAVADLGELPDGRAWYTMQEVRGQTLGEVVAALHRGEGWTLRRVVDLLLRAAQTVASAHAAGVAHRDLKPDNVMVGAFGEVRVMDWGLAAPIGEVRSRLEGTPAYMAPERTSGAPATAAEDVYALGAMLYTILQGRSPYPGEGRAAWLAVLAGGPSPLPAHVPGELRDVCASAMARDPAERTPGAERFAEGLAAWLDGARREEEAQALVDTAAAAVGRAMTARAEAARQEEEASRLLSGVVPSDPLARKLRGFRAQDDALALRRDAERAEAEARRDLRAALRGAPGLASAHRLLAQLAHDRLVQAEATGDTASAVDAELELREHDRGRYAGWLSGEGAVTLHTDVPARVVAFRLVHHDRRLTEVERVDLGTTPLDRAPLPRGSWVLHLEAPGRVPVRYPIRLGRLDHWSGVRPGDSEPLPIHLPPTLPPDVVYVPAGPFPSGGDPGALDSHPLRVHWVDALLVRRFPVTFAEWITFLEQEPDPELVPRSPEGRAYVERRDGRLVLVGHGGPQDPRDPGEPVAYVTAVAAERYAEWESRRTGVSWRLPHELEWEKAARGVDGRAFPWGDTLDPGQSCMQASHGGVPRRARVEEWPDDESVYGVRGLGGNVRDWCANDWTREPFGAEIVLRPGATGALRAVRGGSIISTAQLCRCASRFASLPLAAHSSLGFRLVSSRW